MVAGILCGQIYRVISVSPEEAVDTKVLWRGLNSAGMWRSLLASPITFGVIYLATREQPDVFVSATIAFENGFICNVIAERRLKRITDSA
jgi:hypothetical protein